MAALSRFVLLVDMRDYRGTEEKPSLAARTTDFLKTGTGVITAVATLLVAVTGLVTAITQFGKDDTQAGSTVPAAVSTGVPADETDALLWSHIPASLRSTCRRSTDQEAGAISAYNCTWRRIVGLQYNLFTSTPELADGFEDVRQRYGLENADGASCPEGNFEGAYEPGGKMVCFVGDDGVASIVWTDDELDIMTFAWRDDGKLDALYDAWTEGVGPDR
jgi:hypothetical protein